jgi:hypothetical protein
MVLRRGKVLSGWRSIATYCGCGRESFIHFVLIGMPAKKIGKRWYANTDNIDEWFMENTKAQNIENDESVKMALSRGEKKPVNY